MGAVSDSFTSAMYELGVRFKDSSICCHLKSFKDGFEFLSLFVDCIWNWSNALEVAPHLRSIAAKIEEALQRIGGEFIEEVKVYKRAFIFNHAGWYSKWINFFEQWNAKIDALKPEIAEACDYIVSIIINNSVKCNSPSLNFHKWEKFSKSKIFFDNDQISYRSIEIRLDEGPSFFMVMRNYNLKNPKIEAFLIKVGISIISAAMLRCQWQAKNFDPNMKQDVDAAFQDLGQKLGFTNPELTDIILEEQKKGASISIANIIVDRLLPYSQRVYLYESSALSELRSELHYVLTTVLDIPKEDALLQIFLPGIKQLVLEIASLYHLLYDEINRNVFMDLLRKVCLIKFH